MPTEVINTQSREQRRVAKPLTAILEAKLREIQEGGLGATALPEELDVNAALDPALRARTDFLTSLDVEQDIGQRDALSDLLSGRPSLEITPEASNRFFEENILPSAERIFDRGLSRFDRSLNQFGATFSSIGQQRRAELISDWNRDLLGKRAELALADRNLQAELAEGAANRQVSAVGLADTLANNIFTRAGQQIGAAAGISAIDQQRQDRRISNFLRTVPENSPWMSAVLNFTNQSHTAVVQTPSTFENIIAGVNAGASLVGAFKGN